MYIVLWLTSLFVSDPCPGMGVPDKFERSNVSYGICSMIHGHTEWRKHSRKFNNKDSAELFYKELIIQQNKDKTAWMMQSKIDSVKRNY